MPEFFDTETKQLEKLYNQLRELLAHLDKENLLLRSVLPQMLVTSTGTDDEPEVTAALVVIQVKGPTAVDALTQLDAAIRIAAQGVQAPPPQDETRVDVAVTVEETATLADVARHSGPIEKNVGQDFGGNA